MSGVRPRGLHFYYQAQKEIWYFVLYQSTDLTFTSVSVNTWDKKQFADFMDSLLLQTP